MTTIPAISHYLCNLSVFDNYQRLIWHLHTVNILQQQIIIISCQLVNCFGIMRVFPEFSYIRKLSTLNKWCRQFGGKFQLFFQSTLLGLGTSWCTKMKTGRQHWYSDSDNHFSLVKVDSRLTTFLLWFFSNLIHWNRIFFFYENHFRHLWGYHVIYLCGHWFILRHHANQGLLIVDSLLTNLSPTKVSNCQLL